MTRMRARGRFVALQNVSAAGGAKGTRSVMRTAKPQEAYGRMSKEVDGLIDLVRGNAVKSSRGFGADLNYCFSRNI